MITLDDVRRFATAFPEVEAVTHFRFGQPVFKVAGKPFAGGGGSTGETTAVFAVSQEESATAIADDPATYEAVWRPGPRKSLIGLRVDLATGSGGETGRPPAPTWAGPDRGSAGSAVGSPLLIGTGVSQLMRLSCLLVVGQIAKRMMRLEHARREH